MSAIFYDVVLYGCKTQKDYNSCSIWQTQTILCGRTPTFCSDLVKRCTDISYMPTKKICLSFGHQKFREKRLLNWKWNIFAQTMRKKAKKPYIIPFFGYFLFLLETFAENSSSPSILYSGTPITQQCFAYKTPENVFAISQKSVR